MLGCKRIELKKIKNKLKKIEHIQFESCKHRNCIRLKTGGT